VLHRSLPWPRLHRRHLPRAQLRLAASPASDALLARAPCLATLLLVRSFVAGLVTSAVGLRLLRPLLTSRSGSAPSPFQAQGEISPGKNTILPRTTAASTPLRLDHQSFAVPGRLASLGSASYAVLVHRLAGSLHASSPRSVALTQLHFTSLTVVRSREDFHLVDRAHAGHTGWLRYSGAGCPQLSAAPPPPAPVAGPRGCAVRLPGPRRGWRTALPAAGAAYVP
jgi:hypothetical protein